MGGKNGKTDAPQPRGQMKRIERATKTQIVRETGATIGRDVPFKLTGRKSWGKG